MTLRVDSIIYNGYMLTMDDHCSQYPHGAIAIDNAHIIDLGDCETICSKYHAKTMIDVHGDVIAPGFINGHTHCAMTLFRGIADGTQLHNWLTRSILPLEDLVTTEEFVYCGTRLAILEMIRGGTTTCVDMYLHPDAVARACVAMGMRGFIGANIRNNEDDLVIAEHFINRWLNHPLITPALAPHAPHTVPLTLLRATQSLSDRHQVPVLMHVAETADENRTMEQRYGQRSIPWLSDEGLLNERLTIAHGVHLTAPEITTIASMNTGIIHCPISNLKLGSGIAPITLMLDTGCAVGLGTDGAASNNSLNMIESIKMAILLQRINPRATLLNSYDGIALATRGAAHAIHQQNQIGTLEPGKKADIISIALDSPHQLPIYDPLSTIAFASDVFDVQTVMINGELVVTKGNYCYASSVIQTIIVEAQDYQKAISSLLKNKQLQHNTI